jgi:hypothetical protein
MPGVDFQTVRSMVSMAQVLELIGFVFHEGSGDQLRGPWPVPRTWFKLIEKPFILGECGAKRISVLQVRLLGQSTRPLGGRGENRPAHRRHRLM